MGNSQKSCERCKWLLKHLHPVCTQIHFPDSHLLCCCTLLHIKSGQGNLKVYLQINCFFVVPIKKAVLKRFLFVLVCFFFPTCMWCESREAVQMKDAYIFFTYNFYWCVLFHFSLSSEGFGCWVYFTKIWFISMEEVVNYLNIPAYRQRLLFKG